MQAPLTAKQYQLKKFPGKGGWTYAEVPEVPADKHAPFGWVCVKGHIDGYVLKRYRLMPMGNGRLFLPVKAEIRKKIGKAAGDWVAVELYPDDSKPEIPADLEDCLKDEPKAYACFLGLADNRQEEWIKWIDGAEAPETRARRIAFAIGQLLKGLPFRKQRAGDDGA